MTRMTRRSFASGAAAAGLSLGPLLDAPDNITVAPDGRLYLCEDGSGGDNIVLVDHDGSLAILAQNISSGSEWAGACFSPVGNVMFVNMQGDGLTFAIKGPWKRKAV